MSIDKDNIITILTEKGAVKPCHRCGRNKFELLDGYRRIALQDDFQGGFVIGGPSVPAVCVACSNCGAVTSHALGALGLLPAKKKEDG